MNDGATPELEIQTTKAFDKKLSKLPQKIQELAEAAISKSGHPLLRKKKLHRSGDLKDNSYSIRVTYNYRAIVQVDGDAWSWYWVGDHEAYDRFTGESRRGG